MDLFSLLVVQTFIFTVVIVPVQQHRDTGLTRSKPIMIVRNISYMLCCKTRRIFIIVLLQSTKHAGSGAGVKKTKKTIGQKTRNPIKIFFLKTYKPKDCCVCSVIMFGLKSPQEVSKTKPRCYKLMPSLLHLQIDHDEWSSSRSSPYVGSSKCL